MGNCVHQQTQNRTSLTSSSSFDNHSRLFHRNLLTNRFTNIRTLSSYNLNALIDETLLIIRTVVDTDQEPPHAMLVVSRIANRDDRWLEVMIALVERIPINDPLGATVIALLLDECSLPSKELLQQLIKRICSNNHARIKILEAIIDEHIKTSKQLEQRTISSLIEPHVGQVTNINTQEIVDINDTTSLVNILTPKIIDAQQSQEKVNKVSSLSALRSTKHSSSPAKTINTSDISTQNKSEDNLHRDRNALVLLGCLAEKLVGPTSTAMLDTIALEYLIDRVYLGIYGYNHLKSIDLEDNNISLKYSSVLKIILFALISLEKFSHTSESKHILLQSLTIKNEQTKMNVLEYYEPWALSDNCLKRQIGFYAQWLLDNVFILDYRRPSYETIDHRYINVMLNDKDVSEYLKIGPDGLEARSDTVSFESVRCTFNVNSGVWYYEALIVTDGVMQIGWATKQSKFMNHEGYGIGDDQYSIAYDGCRNLIWFGAKSIPHTNPPWKLGDIVGCLIDFDRREVIFSLNGRSLDPFRKIFSSTSNSNSDGYFAAASFMSYQHCRFNFGSIPFRYPPTTVTSFKTFNKYGHLSDNEKLILPKYKKLELLRSIEINEQDCILCVDSLANILLKPCQHTGFCEQCAYKLDVCPICRSDIRIVQIWDAITNRKTVSFPRHTARVGALAWNDHCIDSGSRDRFILQNDTRSSKQERKLAGHRQEVCGLKWSPDRQLLAVWSQSCINPIQIYTDHTAAVKAIVWSPHQQGLLASDDGTADRYIRLWNTLTAQSLQCIDTGSKVCNLARSKHLNELVSTHGYSQNQIVVWKYPSMLQLARLTEHTFRVLYLAVSPDGESIFIEAGDETLRFWNVFTKCHANKESDNALNLFNKIR